MVLNKCTCSYFFYWRAHQNLSQDLVYLKQHIFYQNNLIIPIHLSQVKHIFLNLCVYLACPKLIWTVTWRDLMQVLSSNEFLRGRIRKERPFFLFSLFYFFFFFGFFFFALFFVVVVFFFKVTLASWVSISKGVSRQLAMPLIIHERGDGVLG